MKLLLLDADVIIDLLEFDLFDSLVNTCEVYVCSTVINEVRTYKNQEVTIPINFRQRYIDTNRVKELSANSNEIKAMLEEVPVLLRGSIGAGETESLTVLRYRSNLDLVFCSCDILAIKFLSYLRMTDRGISLEKVLNTYRHKKVNLQPKHSEQHFNKSIRQGKIEFVQNIQLKKE